MEETVIEYNRIWLRNEDKDEHTKRNRRARTDNREEQRV